MNIRSTKCPMANRRGFSLLEMTIVISVSSALLVMLVSGINTTKKFSSAMDDQKIQHQQLSRLANDLRRAVHDCETMEIRNVNELHLFSQGESTVFKIGDETVTMEKSVDDKTAREEYRLARGSVIQWDAKELPEKIALIVNRERIRNLKEPPKDDSNLKLDLHVKAYANRRSVTSSSGGAE